MRTSAIPKGPILAPQLKRQASPTTDHTLEYRHFEGVLEEGQDGAGPVMVWDEGTSIPEREIAKGVLEAVTERAEAEALMRASAGCRPAEIQLYGHKLQGSFALFGPEALARIRAGCESAHRDRYTQTRYDASEYDCSAGNLRSLAEITAQPASPP